MDDQASKLTSLGFRVARIHSGLNRATRGKAVSIISAGNSSSCSLPGAAARDRVPGDAGKTQAGAGRDRRGTLHFTVGHDFRPDYRKLSQYLPALRRRR